MGEDEERDRPRVRAAPVAGRLVRVPSADHRADGRHRLVEELPVGPGRPAEPILVLVRPRAAEDPVVEPLAALTEALLGAVVRAGDVAVERGGLWCQGLEPANARSTGARNR